MNTPLETEKIPTNNKKKLIVPVIVFLVLSLGIISLSLGLNNKRVTLKQKAVENENIPAVITQDSTDFRDDVSPYGFSGVPDYFSTYGKSGLNLWEESGARWIRFGLGWTSVQYRSKNITEGTFSWTYTDDVVNTFLSKGFKLLPIFGFNLTYDPNNPDSINQSVLTMPDLAPRIFLPELNKQVSYWEYYLFKTVQRYKDRIKYWEIWNEEDQNFWFNEGYNQVTPTLPPSPNPVDYAKLLQKSYAIIKQADPTAQVLLGGMSLWDPAYTGDQSQTVNQKTKTYLTNFYNTDANGDGQPDKFNNFDIFAIHPYVALPRDNHPDSMTAYLTNFIAFLRTLDTSYNKEIWSNEVGYNYLGCNGTSPEPQQYLDEETRVLERTYNQSLNHASGLIKKVFWYKLIPNSKSSTNSEDVCYTIAHCIDTITPTPAVPNTQSCLSWYKELSYTKYQQLAWPAITCSITIKSTEGNETCTNSKNVILNNFPAGATGMKFWNEGDLEPAVYEPYSSTKNWIVNGWSTSRVWVKFNNPSKTSNSCNDTISYPCPTNTPTPTLTLPLCSQVGVGYEWAGCSNDPNEGTNRSGCYNNVCYTDIHSTLNTASNCTSSAPYCRYYNYETCGVNTCVLPSGLNPCFCATPTPTLTPTKTPTPTFTPTPAVNVIFSSKKGLGGPVPVSHFGQLGIGWFYNWSFIPGLKDPSGLGTGNANNINWNSQIWEKFVPLFLTSGKDWVPPMSDNYTNNMNNICRFTNYCQGNYYLVGNEPNLCGFDWAVDGNGACLSRTESIARSVKVYGEIIKMIKSKDQNAKIILLGLASGDSNGVGTFDTNYFNEFIDKWKTYWLTEKNDPVLKNLADAIAGWHIHLYGLYSYCPANDSFAQNVKQSINQKMQAVFGKTVLNQEIWITEMGSLVGIPTSGIERDKFKNRMRCLVNIYEGSSAIDRYAWFYHGCGTTGSDGASACYGSAANQAYVLYNSNATGYSQTDLRPIYASIPLNISPTKTPISTPTATKTPTLTPTRTPTATNTQIPTNTPLPTVTPTLSPCLCSVGMVAKSKGNSDCNEIVDLRDLMIWREERTAGTALHADFNCDGIVDIRDLMLWRENHN